jgi:very-short-patch-repair endonuclease
VCKPKPPEPPDILLPWLDSNSGGEPDTPPKLRTQGIEKAKCRRSDNLFGTDDEKANEELGQDVQTAYEAFRYGIWESWKAQYEAWQQQSSIHDHLYQLRDALERSVGGWELILGVGCLSWTVNGQDVRRHLIEARVDLAFEAHEGTFTLGPAADGAGLTLVEDMLDAEYRPDNTIRHRAEKALEKAADDPWNFEAVDKCLRTYANGLRPNGGEYEPNEYESLPAGHEPRIDFAPALILRERNDRGYQRLVKSILLNLEAEDVVPELIRQLIVDPNTSNDSVGGVTVEQVTPPPQGRTYFPLHANEDQLEIVNRYYDSKCVLVQGPPGTGKSHTIANLICHLLATGKRVLVTAQTARALKVLREKLPEEIRPLCLMSLGTDRESRRLKEQGIRAIIEKMDHWKPQPEELKIRSLEQELDKLDRRKSELENELRTRRESETHQQEIPGTVYRGTAQTIADLVNRDRDRYRWFRDDVHPDSKPVVSTDELRIYLAGLIRFPAEQQTDLAMPRQEVPTDDTLLERVRKYHEVRGRLPYQDPGDDGLRTIDSDDIRATRSALQVLLEKIRIAKSRSSWCQQAVSDVLTGNGIAWAGRHSDTTELLSYFQTGGWRGFWLLRPKVVRRTKYLFTEIMLTSVPTVLSDPRHVLIRSLEEVCGRLGCIVDLQQVVGEVNLLLDRLSLDNRKPLVEPDVISDLITRCDSELNRRELVEISGELDVWISAVRSVATEPCAHPVGLRLAESLTRRDVSAVAKALYECRNLDSDAIDLKQWQIHSTKVKESLPILAGQMAVSPSNPAWGERLADWSVVWDWARADAWVRRYTDPDKGDATAAGLDITKKQFREKLLHLVETKAWQSCHSLLTPQRKKDLKALETLEMKFGKGTGKMAGAIAVDIRKQFDRCKKAIPAWVMSLDQLTHYVDPEPGLFDVAVVDEASQCDPRSIALLYLAKKIIIVGDDKQISPDTSGVKAETVQLLIKKHLFDLPGHVRACMSPDSSLYGLARIHVDKPILLREHFRCASEIIRFSNSQFYDNRLVPLRQAPINRLEPLQVKYVADGKVEGSDTTLRNLPEAEQIVASIKECCQNPKFNGKLMGVITLRAGGQDKLIARMLQEAIGKEEYEERKIICGNARSLQGDERDVIFLSMVVAPNKDYVALVTKEYERQFNVAASRARDQMWLFHSVKPDDITNTECMRKRLLTFFYDPVKHQAGSYGIDLNDLRSKAGLAKRPDQVPSPFDSWFEVDLYLRLVGRGFDTEPQKRVNQYRIDMVVKGVDRSLAVECDGDTWHGPDRYEADMARQKQLERAGWPFWRVWGSAYYHDHDKALESLWKRLDDLHIHPLRNACPELAGTSSGLEDSARPTTVPGGNPASGDRQGRR